MGLSSLPFELSCCSCRMQKAHLSNHREKVIDLQTCMWSKNLNTYFAYLQPQQCIAKSLSHLIFCTAAFSCIKSNMPTMQLFVEESENAAFVPACCCPGGLVYLSNSKLLDYPFCLECKCCPNILERWRSKHINLLLSLSQIPNLNTIENLWPTCLLMVKMLSIQCDWA